jgi:hypothetical protein
VRLIGSNTVNADHNLDPPVQPRVLDQLLQHSPRIASLRPLSAASAPRISG